MSAPAITPRQREIVARLADGLTYREIARDLGISPATVRSDVQAMAALCLHGHPQGFTRADVALIRSRFDLSDDQWRTDEESAAASLAARIEALLPPEGA